MARKRRRSRSRMSGLSIESAAATCRKFYRDPSKAQVCIQTSRSLIKKIVANKPHVCKKFCGCGG